MQPFLRLFALVAVVVVRHGFAVSRWGVTVWVLGFREAKLGS